MKRLMEYIRNNPKINEFLKDNRDMIIKVAAAVGVIVVAFFVFGAGGDDSETVEAKKEIAVEETKSPVSKIYVDVGGEVKTPLVAELEEGSRVKDAIEAAGGLTANADIADVNRAAFVEDGEKIFIPSKPVMQSGEGQENISAAGSESGGETDYGNAALYDDGKININTADSVELQELDGIGPVTAEKIIDYREENGRFSDIEDIKNVSGIGDKTFEKLEDDIKV